MFIEIENKHPDILVLENRLRFLVKYENYECAAIVKKWLDELLVHHHSECFTSVRKAE